MFARSISLSSIAWLSMAEKWSLSVDYGIINCQWMSVLNKLRILY